MGRRFLTVLLSSALVAGVFTALPAGAQEAGAVTIPEVVQIDDPKGDANYLNDQSLLNAVPPTEDNSTPADGGSTSDLLKVWYTTTAETISAHIQTELPAPATAASYIYRVYSNPGEGAITSSTLGCLRFFVFMPSANPPVGGYSGPLSAGLLDYCDKGTNYTTDAAAGKLTMTELGDGTGVMSIEVPRSYSPKLANGQVLTAPHAEVHNLVGTGTDGNGQPIPATDGTLPGGNWRRGPQIDNSKIGTDFTITGPAPVDPPKPTKPGKPAKPAKPATGDANPGAGKKNGCDNGKGKKKGCPTVPPAAAGCAPYTPGEEGKDAHTTVVTDAATAEAPVVVELTAAAGLGDDLGAPTPYDETSSVFENVQVDSAAASAGLYAKVEFQEFHDYDLYLNYPDGSTAANSGDFNVAPGEGIGGGSPDGAWEAGTDYEQVMGINTADCAGYTARIKSYLTNGGAVTLSLWLGDAVAEPDPAGGEALSLFYELMGL